MGSYRALDGELQNTGRGVTEHWMVSYRTLDGELQNTGWGVTEHRMVIKQMPKLLPEDEETN